MTTSSRTSTLNPRPGLSGSNHAKVLLFNKPCGVLCQFSPSAGKRTLKDFIAVADVYPAAGSMPTVKVWWC